MKEKEQNVLNLESYLAKLILGVSHGHPRPHYIYLYRSFFRSIYSKYSSVELVYELQLIKQDPTPTSGWATNAQWLNIIYSGPSFGPQHTIWPMVRCSNSSSPRPKGFTCSFSSGWIEGSGRKLWIITIFFFFEGSLESVIPTRSTLTWVQPT